MLLYHGSNKIIKSPIYGFGKETNDYGKGFYLTKDIDLAREWASNGDTANGIVNIYDFDIDKLNMLDLDKVDNKVLSWMALLVRYRAFDVKFPIALQGKKYLIDNYLIDVNKYDVIKGYRADDCYFMFARTFLNNGISVDQLGKALTLGKLGTQYVLKSKKAFGKIKYKGYEKVDTKEYYHKRLLRNHKAASEYDDMLEKNDKNGIFINDILNGRYEKENK